MSSVVASMDQALTPYTPIRLGRTISGDPVDMALHKLANFNMFLAGMSGTGKTYGIEHLIEELHARGILVIALDTQGDLGTRFDESIRNDIHFRPGNPETASLNPLRINTGAEGEGGAFVAVEDAITAMRLMKRSLGDRQEAELRRQIIQLFEKFGIALDALDAVDSTGKYVGPDWRDFEAHLKQEIHRVREDDVPHGIAFLKEAAGKYRKEAARVQRSDLRCQELLADKQNIPRSEFERKLRRAEDMAYKSNEKLKKIRAEQTDRFVEVIAGDTTAELEGDRPEAGRLEGIYDTVANMNLSGLFGEDYMPLKKGKINILRMKPLRDGALLTMIHLVLERLYYTAFRTCPAEKMNIPVPRIMVVLDEIKLAVATVKSTMSPLSRIATEARKAGMGIIAGGQHYGQLNEELRTNFATQILLPTESSRQEEVRKIMRCPADLIASLEPRRNGLVKMNEGAARLVNLWER